MSTKIFVAVHIPYALPEDDLYVPIQVGAALTDRINSCKCTDDTGENISTKNPNFCELTGLYWVWKNFQSSSPIGLVHYRRYFGIKGGNHSLSDILNRKQVESLLAKAPVILPPKRNYFIETIRSHYEHAHHAEDLTVLRSVLEANYPNYIPAFDRLMNQKTVHILNMFIMRKDLFNQYCKWLFSVLFEVEKHLDISSYHPNDARVFGFLGERLLDVWIDTNQIHYVETPVVHLERTNWIKKGSSFLRRKFLK